MTRRFDFSIRKIAREFRAAESEVREALALCNFIWQGDVVWLPEPWPRRLFEEIRTVHLERQRAASRRNEGTLCPV